MNIILKIALTPLMFLISLALAIAGIIYYQILVRIYDFAWEGWKNE